MPVCLSICLLMKLSRYPPLVQSSPRCFPSEQPWRKIKMSAEPTNKSYLCIIIVIIIIIIIIIRKRGIGEVK